MGIDLPVCTSVQ